MIHNNPYENPYDENEFLNPDCDCYGCATMRHACQYEKKERRTMEKRTKPPMNAIDLENFVLQHIAAWVEEAVERTDGETKNFYEYPELFRDKMDRFTNSTRNKWFAYEKRYKLREAENGNKTRG